MFVGRDEELTRLEKLYRTGSFQMAVVYGRRRVGKTTLVHEFAKSKKTLFFTALDQADKDNLADFSTRVWEFFDMPQAAFFASWADAFDFLAKQAERERFILVFDEFPYAAARNKALPSVLQACIDSKLKQGKLFLVLCGSNQGFMESEVLGRKSPLYGRRTAQLKIEPLGYLDAAKMLPGLDVQECFRYYGCFGGVPYYLEQVDAGAPFWENVAEQYFDTTGFLYDEPYGLLRQEFNEPALYASILRAVAGGAGRMTEISEQTGIARTSLPRYLSSLAALGIVERAVPFGENPATSKRAIYRIEDACYDFWFAFVMPRVSEIEQGLGRAAAKAIGDARLDTYLGKRFERLCAEWLVAQAKAEALPIAATSVGSWWGTNPALREQDDIDVLAADTSGKRMLIAECKYRESFDESEAFAKLEARRDLVKGYETVAEYLFSKRTLSDATLAKIAQDPRRASISLAQMYASPSTATKRP